MRIIFSLLLITIFLSACTGSRYGHYNYVKKDKTLSVQVPATKERKQDLHLAQKQAVSFSEHLPDSAIKVLSTPQTLPKHIVNIPKKNILPIHKTAPAAIIKNATVSAAPKELNKNARNSLIYALAAFFVTIIPGVGPIVAFVFWARAIKKARRAFDEMDEEPKKYRGEGMAMAAIIISTMVIAASIFLLFYAITAFSFVDMYFLEFLF